MLKRINELLNSNQNFAFETTLSTKSYKNKIIEAQNKNYTVTLLFFWLQSQELAIERVKTRVAEGRHNIDNETIKRRYIRGIKNLFEIYLPIVDNLMIFDNSFEFDSEIIAVKLKDEELIIMNDIKFENLKKVLQ